MNKTRNYLIYGIGIAVVVVGLFAAGRLGGGGAADQASVSQSLLGGKEAPDFTLTDLAGNAATLSEYRGEKPVLIEFLAVWCPHCQNQTRENKKLLTMFPGNEFEFLSINSSPYGRAYSLGSLNPAEEEDLIWYRDKYSVEERLFMDDGTVGAKYGLRNFPSFALVGVLGNVLWQGSGEISAETLKAEIERALQVPPSEDAGEMPAA